MKHQICQNGQNQPGRECCECGMSLRCRIKDTRGEHTASWSQWMAVACFWATPPRCTFSIHPVFTVRNESRLQLVAEFIFFCTVRGLERNNNTTNYQTISCCFNGKLVNVVGRTLNQHVPNCAHLNLNTSSVLSVSCHHVSRSFKKTMDSSHTKTMSPCSLLRINFIETEIVRNET